MIEYFVIGKIVNTQGLKGEIRVLPTTDDVKRFKKLNKISVYKKGEITEYNIESVRLHKQFVLLKLKGIDNIDDAQTLRDSEIKIHKDDAIPCEKDEYYISDLYGINAVTEDGEDLGELTDIIFTGANDVYVIKKEDKQILIPAIKKCILDVNVKENIMIVHLLEGLR